MRLSDLMLALVPLLVTICSCLVLAQVKVEVTLCGQLFPTGISTCLAGPTTSMPLLDYLTHKRYPEFTYIYYDVTFAD
jgi:hypothetical protein